MANHSYEEIRAAALDILAGREKTSYEASQYEHLSIGIAEVFERRGGGDGSRRIMGDTPKLRGQDAELLLEVFWDLFRQGIITLGYNDSNREFPFFRVSHSGKAVLQNQNPYFFHDVSTYERLIRAQVPAIDDTTLLYLKEAMQAFRSGCILSATVMLGVAAEHTFLTVLDTIDANPKHEPTYAPAQKERNILPKVNKFRAILDKHLAAVPGDLKEDLDTNFTGIQSLIRTFRNDAGHPTGKIVEREQAFVLLSLFIPYAKKMYQLRDYFAQP
jgi:hypothetical protein